MKYELHFVCENNGEQEECGYDVEFFFNPEQYGNGTTMSCKNHKAGYASYYFDIRYNREYREDRQFQFIVDWVLNTWNGENGSWRVKSITVTEVSDDVR